MPVLANPLTHEQIECAHRIYLHLQQWVETDSALHALSGRFPGFDADAVLLKVVAVNALYGTNVYAVSRMARHIQNVMNNMDAGDGSKDLVERLAKLPAVHPDEKRRVHLSFASKFAHFFIDSDLYPIMDSYAEKMLLYHIGSRVRLEGYSSRYAQFMARLRHLVDAIGWTGSNCKMDRYLWLAGQYVAWRQNPKAQINGEVLDFFTYTPKELVQDLNVMAKSL